MEKNDLMKEYEIKIDSIVNWKAHPIGYTRYIESELLKARLKAEAYDRLMSGGKKTMKELANILGRVVVVNANGDIESFAGEPSIDLHYGFWYLDEDDEDYEDDRFLIPRDIVDFTGDWKNSITFPDGWEERINQEETFDYNLEQLGLK